MPRSKRKRSDGSPAPRRRSREAATGPEPSSSEPDETEEVLEETTMVEASRPWANEEEGNDQAQEKETLLVESLDEQNKRVEHLTVEETKGESTASQSASREASETTSEPPSREQKIRQLLEHRKILLDRLQKGRVAAQKRLDLIYAKEPSRKQETDDQEITAFREMAKNATSLARKQAKTESEAAVEKRTSVSLRRGSGVGKRMNAALSSLAPGGGVSMSIDPSSSSSIPIAASSTIPGVPPPSGMPPPSILPVPGVARAGSVSRPPAALVRKDQPKIQQPGPGRPVVPKNLKMPPKTAGMRSMLPPSAPSLPTNYRLFPPVPVVVCPEAAALRERKRSMEEKLANLLKSRQRRLETSRSPGASGRDVMTLSPKSPSNITKEIAERALRAAIKGPGRPTALPRRRKTQWDYVLEEMRWLATDFREERKWKVSCARTMAGSILSRESDEAAAKDAAAAARTAMDVEPMPSPNANGQDEEAEQEEVPENGFQSGDEKSHASEPAKESKYVDVSAEDFIAARKVSKIVSNMVLELNLAIESGGAATKATEEYVKALERHRLARERLDGDHPMALEPKEVTDDQAKVQGDSAAEQSNGALGEAVEEIETVENIFEKAEERDAYFDSFSQLVDGVLRKVDQPAPKSKGPGKVADVSLILSADQVKVGERIEDTWTRVKCGALVGGSGVCGKTILACSILSNHQADGPQLLVCSSASMIRWIHELGRFEGLTIRLLGPSTGISSPSTSSDGSTRFEAGDVVVCDYSTVESMAKDDLSTFVSVFIDMRYPRGFFGARSAVSESICGASGIVGAETPHELTSSSWWARLASVTGKARRLVIDSILPSDGLPLFAGLSDRQLLEVLGLRLVFLLGASGIKFPFRSVQKAVLAWARRRIKDEAASGTKFERTRKLFLSLTDALYCELEGGLKLDHRRLYADGSNGWDVRACEMPPRQRIAYDEACTEARVTLSQSLDSLGNWGNARSEALLATAESILHLRRLCFLSDWDTVVRTGNKTSAHGSLLRTGASQPCVAVAAQIIERSGKMKELLSILVNECDVDVEGADRLLGLSGRASKKASSKSKSKRTPERRKRVAIVAALPEARALVSLLLGAIGINHEILAGCTGSQSMVGMHDTTSPDEPVDVARRQMTLSRFADDSGRLAGRSVDFVIGAPAVFGGDHSGLSIDVADFVICLDEDWSGRSQLQLGRIAARCRTRGELANDGECHLIKLVTGGSCEHAFLAHGSGGHPESFVDEWPWPVDALGSFAVPDSDVLRRIVKLGKVLEALKPFATTFTFPARNLMAARNEELSVALGCGHSLLLVLACDSLPRFLPGDQHGLDVTYETEVISTLMSRELEASAGPIWSCKSLNISRSAQVAEVALSSGPVTRADLAVLPTRLYLQRVGNRVADKSHMSASEFVVPPSADLAGPGMMLASTTSGDTTMWADESPFEIPDPSVNSLLFYDVNGSKASFGGRANAYSQVFGCVQQSTKHHDGSAGAESLVYFPPLFPRMLECSALARRDIDSLRSLMPGSSESDVLQMDANEPLLPASKRPRLEENHALTIFDGPNGSSELKSPKVSSEPKLITEDEASHSDAASVLLDLTDDYGLAGIGAVPLPRDSALVAGSTSTEPMTFSTSDATEWLSGWAACDAEEVGQRSSILDSMLLFVSRKRPRGYGGMPGQITGSLLPRQGIQASGGLWPGAASAAPADFYSDMNGGAKNLKKNNAVISASAFNRLPTVAPARPTAAPGIQAKDMYRNHLLVRSLPSGPGNTLFESPLFRASCVRVRNRVAEHLARQSWTSSAAFEIGPGLPLHVSKPHASSVYRGLFQVDPNLWTSLVKRLKTKNSRTGEEAVQLATVQQVALRRSTLAPCRVDFGPFQAGFLSSPTGATVVPSQKVKSGISLPMGVKLHSQKDVVLPPWSADMDHRLLASVDRVGTNWNLVALSLGGFQDVVVFSESSRTASHAQISSRLCRERWDALTHLAKDAPVNEDSGAAVFDAAPEPVQRVPLAESEERGAQILAGAGATEFLLTTSGDTTKSPYSNVDTSDPSTKNSAETKQKRSFGAFAAAKTKQHTVPISIPGVVSGSPPTVVASHPSHMQSVQSSAAAAWMKGRTEMWPLQLLDAAERQRGAVAAATAAATAAPAIAAPPVRPPSNPSRPASKSPPSSNSVASRRPGPPVVPQRSSSGPMVPGHPAGSPHNSQSRSSSSSMKSFIPPTLPSSQQKPRAKPAESSASGSNNAS